MKLINSIRHQAVALFVSFAAGLSMMYISLAVLVAFIVEDEMIAQLLNIEADYIEQTYAQSGELVDARLAFVQVYPNKQALPVFVKNAINKGVMDNEVFTPEKEHFHFKPLSLSNSQTGYLLAEVSSLLIVTTHPSIFVPFLCGLIITLIVAAWLAIKMAAFTVKPVIAMTDAVKQQRPLPQLQFELGYLSQTLQSAFDDLSKSLKREKDFTTDISHELRTPLTVFNNTITLGEQRGLSKDDIAQLRHAGDQMLHTIEVLFALARAENVEKQPCRLKPVVEQVAMTCAMAQNKAIDLQMQLPDSYCVDAEPTLLNLLITNLVNNALTHGSDNTLRVSAREKQLTFQNLGDQVTSQTSDSLDLPGVKSEQSPGIGQGLYLVSRIVEALGWTYQLNLTDGQFSINISL